MTMTDNIFYINTGTKGLVKDLIPDEIAIKTSPTNHQLLPTPLIREAQ